MEELSTAFEGKLSQMGESVLQSTLSSVDFKIKQLEIQNQDYKLQKEEEAKFKKLEGKVDEKKINNRLDELSDYYRHLNKVVENMIEKFSVLEKVSNKVMKQSTLPPIKADPLLSPTSPAFQQAQLATQSMKQSLEQ